MDSDTRLLISCVAENDALYTAEVLLLFKTIRKFGGRIANANSELIANFVKSVDPIVKQSLEDLGVKVRIVEAFDNRNPTSNKIRILDIDDYDYDVLIALDCDTIVVRDFSNKINPEFFQAMPVDTDLLTVQQWRKLFSHFNWELPPEKFNSTKKNIIPYFNSGVLLFPKQYVRQIRKSWGEYVLRLFEYCEDLWLNDLTYQRYFFEELALSLAIEKEKIPSEILTLEMNFSVQSMNGYIRAVGPSRPNLQPHNMSPFILHYHHLYNLDGSLAKSGYKIPDLAIERVNTLFLLNSSGTNNNNHIIAKKSSNPEQPLIPIAKDIKVLQKVSLAKQKNIEDKERLVKSMDDQLKKAIKDVETLQYINLGHQKTIEQKERLVKSMDDQLKKAIKDVETLQNINLEHQKTIEQKERLVKSMDDQLKKATKDVVTLHNINLGHQKTIEQKDVELKKAIKDVETLHNINLGHQKTIEEKDKKIKYMQMELRTLKATLDDIHQSKP